MSTKPNEIVDLVKKVTEQKQRQQSIQAAADAARKDIRSRGQFIPKQPSGVSKARFSF
jgi:hypothetical protein